MLWKIREKEPNEDEDKVRECGESAQEGKDDDVGRFSS